MTKPIATWRRVFTSPPGFSTHALLRGSRKQARCPSLREQPSSHLAHIQHARTHTESKGGGWGGEAKGLVHRESRPDWSHSSDEAAEQYSVLSTQYSVLHRHRFGLEVFQQGVLPWGARGKHNGRQSDSCRPLCSPSGAPHCVFLSLLLYIFLLC